ncbi:MAG: DUF2635 domain-containing protein [Planctomycetaceae bacterium]|nr:DUF2635 domain-containing protein [Planctomycetaceae bacterium]
MDTIHIKPARWAEDPSKCLYVPDPVTGRPLPEEGAVVESSRYWRRRLASAEVVLVESKAKPEKEI